MLRALALVVVVLAVPLSAGARPAATAAFVIDRTFSCSATPDPLRKIIVSATSGFRDPENRQRWMGLPSAEVQSRFVRIVYLTAGGAPVGAPALAINVDRCTPSTTRMPLSRMGLAGGPASQLSGSDAYECVVSRFLVRVRAVFRSRVTLSVQRQFGHRMLAVRAGVAPQEVQLAIRTRAGKPLAYATASETGKATLFVAPGCVSD